MVLDFSKIKAVESAAEARFKDVPVEEWGGSVRVARLGAKKQMAFSVTHADMNGDTKQRTPEQMVDFYCDLLQECCVDEKGKPLFKTKEGREILEGLGLPRLQSLAIPALEINGMTKDTSDIEEALAKKKRRTRSGS